MCSLSSLFCLGFGFEYTKLSYLLFFPPKNTLNNAGSSSLFNPFPQLNVGRVTLSWATAVTLNAFW